MVDTALLAQVMKLDAASRLELRDAIDDSLGDDALSPEIWAILEQRVAELEATPSDFASLEHDERETRARRRAG